MPESTIETEEGRALRQRLAEAGRILASSGQGEWTRGHLSIRCPHDPSLFYMKPRDIGLEEIDPDNIVTIGMDGEPVDGNRKVRHGEVFIHSEILRARPDVNAVIHVHPMYAIIFASLGKKLVAVGLPGAVFDEGLPVFDYTTQLISTQERGAELAKSLGPHKAVLLQNHGVVTVGASIEEAIYITMALESACQMQVIAESAGGPVKLGRPEETAAVRKHMLRDGMYKSTFAYLLRNTDRKR